jgi:uncharacterized repeat protein (TIGR01451 family)
MAGTPRFGRVPLLIILILAIGIGAHAQTLVVTNSNLQGWVPSAVDVGPGGGGVLGTIPPASTFLGAGFETPPAGVGSVHFSVGSDGADAARMRHGGYAGVLLSNLTALSYSTFTEVDGSGGQSPYLILSIDTNGDTTADDFLFFEPVYQTGSYPGDPVPNQGMLVADTWQTWNALVGGWWSANAMTGGPPLVTLATYAAANPTARIVNSGGAGGVRIQTGSGAGAWNNFLGAADNFTIGVSGTNTTYDFEPDALTTITITPPTAAENWTLTTTDDNGGVFGASSTVVNGPGTPPIGTGSLQLAVGPDGDDSAQARSNRFDGLFLRDLHELDYQAYHQSGGSGGQMPYIQLRVDYDNNGTLDDILFFEPVYQTGAFCPSNPQPAVATGVWQAWEALNGCWWSLNNIAAAGPGVNVKPLSAILDVEPDARLSTGEPGGAVRIVAGFGSGAWDNFIGNVDAFNISFSTVAPPTRALYDFDPLPIISIADLGLNEGNAGNTPFNFLVTLNKPVSYTVTVQYSTADNTATVADGDYTAVPLTTITFVANDTSENALVNVTGDTKFELNDTFLVNLANSVNATIGDNQATGTILNDDGQPTITVNDVTQAELNAGTSNFNFTVALSNPSYLPVTVNYATADGTATTAGADYTANSGMVTILPNATSAPIAVSVNGDLTFEANETFFVNLTNPGNATFTDNLGLGTIVNDDPQPAIFISDVTLAENAGSFVFNVALSNPSVATITVDYTTAPGTAIAGTDYTTTAGTLTFNPGVTTQPITVPITNDTTAEPSETFFVNLTNATNATIADNQGLGTITNDDAAPTITISDVPLNEGNAGTTPFPFVVTLSNPSASTITVDYATAPGTATAGVDYTTISGTVTFNPGIVTQPISVDVLGDLPFEANETFFVHLTNPTNAAIGDNQGLGTILNDDGPVADISIAKTGPVEAFHGQPVNYTITVSNAGPQTASNVVVTDVIPAGTTFVSSTPSQGSCTGTTTVSCTVGAIAAGGTATISLVVTAPAANGPFSNTATASNTPEGDPTPANNAGSAVVIARDQADVPTLSEWALLALMLALAAFAAMKLR